MDVCHNNKIARFTIRILKVEIRQKFNPFAKNISDYYMKYVKRWRLAHNILNQVVLGTGCILLELSQSQMKLLFLDISIKYVTFSNTSKECKSKIRRIRLVANLFKTIAFHYFCLPWSGLHEGKWKLVSRSLQCVSVTANVTKMFITFVLLSFVFVSLSLLAALVDDWGTISLMIKWHSRIWIFSRFMFRVADSQKAV